jgi:Ca-activated chloride channel homolog
MTSRTGGTTYYISKAGELQKLLREKFANLNQVFAEKVLLEANWQPGVEVGTAFRLQPDAAPLFGNEKILLGNILKHTDLAVIFELVIQPGGQDDYRRRLMDGALTMVLPFDRGMTYKVPFQLNRLVIPLDQQDPLEKEFLDAVSRLTLYHMQENALKQAAEGKYEAAGNSLHYLAKHFYSLGEITLAQTTLQEADRIRQTRLLSAEGQKIIKYATRALLLPGTVREAG